MSSPIWAPRSTTRSSPSYRQQHRGDFKYLTGDRLDDWAIDNNLNGKLKWLGNTAIDLTPGIGDVKGYAEAESLTDYYWATVGLIPLGGDIAKGMAKGARNTADAVADEAGALQRIGSNPNGPDLTGKPSGTVLEQQTLRRAETVSTAKPGQATAPRDLNEQVVWNQVKTDPAAGRRLDGMNNDARFPTSAGFQKMEATHRLPDGSAVTIHYQYNKKTGKAYDMKIVTPQPNALQPGPSKR